MVELHNHYRAQANPPAANMLQMTWDEDLAAFAKAYAQQCVWGHNSQRGRRGENLFAITDQGLDVPLAVEEWHHERKHYNLSNTTCEPDQMCGHYTQVVWAKTERIGCGTHFCEKLKGVEVTDIQLLVCNYEPPGNVKGQKPYQEGTPCSQCPSGYHCKNSLCELIRGPEIQDVSDLVTEMSSPLATEASDSRKTGIPSSLATKTPSFLVTGASGSQATKTLPAIENTAPASLATEDPNSKATETPPSLTAEVLSLSSTHSLLSSDAGPASFLSTTHGPTPQLADAEASSIRMPSKSPKSPLLPKMSLRGTQEPQKHSQGKLEVRTSPSSEVLASVLPTQGEAGGLQATMDHLGNTSNSLSNSPDVSATANAKGGRTLALQSSFPGAEGPGKSVSSSGLNSGLGHKWGPLLELLILLPLVLAGIF